MQSILPAIVATGLIALSGCATGSTPPNTQQPADDCPVIKSENWAAAITPVPNSQDRFQLAVTGMLTLPTPGYIFAWEQGRLDRSAVPSFELRLLANRPDGIVAQVIDTRKVTYAGPAAAAQYRDVTITCAGRILKKIENVR